MYYILWIYIGEVRADLGSYGRRRVTSITSNLYRSPLRENIYTIIILRIVD